MQDIAVRPERPGDAGSVFGIHRDAFGRDDEAHLVERLRTSAIPFLSLVACRDSKVVGHVLFTPVRIEGDPDALTLVGLGPIAVSPNEQHQGIGSTLVRSGLEDCERRGVDAVFVLGHPEYYARFGFRLACELGLFYESQEFASAFFVRELRSLVLGSRCGLVRYVPEFGAV